MLRKAIKRITIALVLLVISVFSVGAVFMYTSPQFGGSASQAQIAEYQKTGHFQDGVFTNAEEIKMEINCHSVEEMLKETFSPNPNVVPHHNIEVVDVNITDFMSSNEKTKVVWLGHSSFLIRTNGKNILLDPVFGQYAAPHPLLGRARFNHEMPLKIADLDTIDLVIISHDHYDHLDYPSIKEMKNKVGHFLVPLGVGNHLRRWEIKEDQITEMDWWNEISTEGIDIVFTPSRHNSGRGISDQSHTLWGSWIIKTSDINLFFSGDGGYGKHFKSIGEKYGPFDFALIECGQYNKNWKDMHMMPEQSVQAALDINCKRVIPVHWGSFSLAPHSWTDPVERITKAAKEADLTVFTPKIGQVLTLNDSMVNNTSDWWIVENKMDAEYLGGKR